MINTTEQKVQAKGACGESKVARVVSFRAPSIVLRQLAALNETWGESVTHVIHRAIAMAHEREFGKKR